MQNDTKSSQSSELDALVTAVAETSLDAPAPPNQSGSPPKSQLDTESPRPLRIYTRAQLLSLHNSPLVKPPPNMPELKTWFGTENEQNLVKKDTDSPTSSTRDRRFRRDYDDGEAPSRTSFRSTLSQPSQMGNFKHQSMRDRDKDRDGDKEGHERLRHLSDKYDRDRLGLVSGNSRTKDRDVFSLTSGSSRNATSTAASGNRRNETREASKRKVAESGDDWRRGGSDLPRGGRDERSDAGRKDRDERENGRSRQGDRSRSRPAPSRRDRGADRDREDEDDGRHWRDDGKRDERIAARRTRDRPAGDHCEPSNERERRWPATDERDSRTKRTNGRERRTNDDVKERDDRKDREKEKEPAWMDTYVPDEPLPGILGGKAGSGEMDSIQAWKKGMKDKEKQEKEKDLSVTTKDEKLAVETQPPAQQDGLDEIQRFRLMMQQEKQKIVTPQPSMTGQDSNADSTSKPPAPETVPSVAQISGQSHHDSPRPQPGSGTQPGGDNAPADPFVPPPGSRLLALGRGIKASGPPIQAPAPVDGFAAQDINSTRSQSSVGAPGLSPFDGKSLAYPSPNDISLREGPFGPSDSQQRSQVDRSPLVAHYAPTQDGPTIDLNSNGHTTAKGSRFAKFFDGKTRDAPVTPSLKTHNPIGFASHSPNIGHRPDQGGFNGAPNNHDERTTVQDLFAMLNNSQQHSLQSHSGLHGPNLGGGILQHNSGFSGHPNVLPVQQQHPHLNHNHSRVESLYDSRLDDRNFVPNDMVPGLRTFPTRNRESFSDPSDDPVLHLQRLSQQQLQLQQLQQRADPSSFAGPMNPLYNQQQNQRSLPLPQQQQFRGNANQPHQMLQQQNSQRFPPGLANLGNRPPHEFLGLVPHGGHVNALSNNGPLPQQFNNFNGNNVPFGNHPQQQFQRGGPPVNVQGLQHSPHIPMGNIAQNHIDPRMASQHFNGGLGGPAMGGGQRLPNINPQQRLGPHPSQLNLRGQQQQQLHPQMLGQMHPTNPPPVHSNNQAQDLMALLMGGPIRD